MVRWLGVLGSLVVMAPVSAFVACSSSGGSGGSSSSSGGGSGSSGSGSGGGSCDVGGVDGGTCPVEPAAAEAVPAFTACADLTAPTVSFQKDIRPIFQQDCSVTSGCHGQAGGEANTPGLVFLGAEDGGTPTATILQGLVNVASPEDPQMQIVQGSHPETSYMMHKLDSDQCRYASACNATGQSTFLECGLGMPYGEPGLCLDTQSDCVKLQTTQQQYGDRDQIRRWIAQGAANN